MARRRFQPWKLASMVIGFFVAAILLQERPIADPTLRSLVYFLGAAGGWAAYEIFARFRKSD